jgi:hypothetical protein
VVVIVVIEVVFIAEAAIKDEIIFPEYSTTLVFCGMKIGQSFYVSKEIAAIA